MNKFYIDSGEKQFQPSQREVLKCVDINRSETSLRTSAVSFRCDQENKYDVEDYRIQLEEQIAENINLKRMLMEEIEKNKCYEQKFHEQQDKFTQVLKTKESDVLNLTKLLRQFELENKTKDELLASSKKIDSKNEKIQEYEAKINILLGENEKLNQILQDRITQIEKMKQNIDQIEKERQQMAEKYELILSETANLSQREKQTIEKSTAQQLSSHKLEYQKQLSILNTQNTQLTNILAQQKSQIEHLEQQLEDTLSQLEDYKMNDSQHQETLMQKERENQDLMLKFNELEKQLQQQNQQMLKLEQQIQSNNEQSIIDEIQKYYENQIETKTNDMKLLHDAEILKLTSQLTNNQNLIEELQGHLTEIYKQITKFKLEKQQLRTQNQELQNQLTELQNELKLLENKNEFTLPSFNISCQSAIMDQSISDERQQNKRQSTSKTKVDQSKNSKQCINQLKQYSLQNNSYKAQFEQKVKKTNQNTYALDSFGNKDRSISCLDMINKGITHFDEEDEISPITQFKQWKEQMTMRH